MDTIKKWYFTGCCRQRSTFCGLIFDAMWTADLTVQGFSVQEMLFRYLAMA
jgi:hypothetical protein